MQLVIGYGNELRRDDGVGPQVARTVAGWNLADVTALACHQLTPELLEILGRANAVCFVDATNDSSADAAILEPIQPAADTLLGHMSSPQALLALVEALSGRCPQAWLLTIRGHDFGFGEGLSPETTGGLEQALHILRHWLTAPG